MGPAVRMEMVDINGEPGMLRFVDGELESAQTFEIENDRIVRIRAQRNPDKLARIAQLFSSK
jgi:RNA polymerase sigma-70 factor (ECF subfamily)